MTPLLQLVLLLLLSYLPVRIACGAFLRPFSALERVTVSLYLSFVLYFLLGLAAFYLGAAGLLFHWLPPAVLVSYGVFRATRGPDDFSFPCRTEWTLLAGVGLMTSWFLLVQISQQVYSGAGWYGDWYEHYERVLLFDGQLALDHKILGLYHLTARPPLFNVLGLYYLDLIGFSFSSYQVFASFVGSCTALPVTLLFLRWRRIQNEGRHRVVVSASCTVFILLILHPMTATNLIYPWTRMLTNGFVLVAFYALLRVVFDRRTDLAPLALLFFGAAHLTHYSADIVIVPSACYLFYRIIRDRRQILTRVAVGVLLFGGLNAAWYVWSVSEFGVRTNVTSNTTWASIANREPLDLVYQHYQNAKSTLLPFSSGLNIRSAQQIDSSLWLYQLYDTMHLYSSQTLVGAISLPLLLVAGVVLWTSRRKWSDTRRSPAHHRIHGASSETKAVLGVCVFAGIVAWLVMPNVEIAGIVHLGMQPMILILLGLLFGTVLSGGSVMRRLVFVLYGLNAFLFYFLKTLDRHREAEVGRVYSTMFYKNLALKVDNGLIFLADEYTTLSEMSQFIIMAAVPALSVVAWRCSGKLRARHQATPSAGWETR